MTLQKALEQQHFFTKGLLLFAVSFFFPITIVVAQAGKPDLAVVVEMMEDRKKEPTEFFQQLSNTTNYISVLAPLSVLATGYASDEKITIQKGWCMAGALVTSSLITLGLKYTVRRSRPFMADSYIVSASSGGGPSFPSGHTSEAFATATSLTLAWPKWWVAVPAYTWAAAVGYSRMYLGVHYPTDVAVGAFVGIGSAWLTFKANQWLHRRETGKMHPVL